MKFTDKKEGVWTLQGSKQDDGIYNLWVWDAASRNQNAVDIAHNHYTDNLYVGFNPTGEIREATEWEIACLRESVKQKKFVLVPKEEIFNTYNIF